MVSFLGKFRNLFGGGHKFAADLSTQHSGPMTLKRFFRSETFEDVARQLLAMPDPDAILRKAGIRRSTLKKLTYDDEIYQAISTRLDGLAIVPVRLEPTETKESTFIQTRCLPPEFLKTIITGAFNARLYGFSIMEIIWDEEVYNAERLFVPKDISLRNMDYFVVRPDGTLVQMIATGFTKDIYTDPELQKKIKDIPGAQYSAVVMDTDYKFLLTRCDPSWDNPYGEALLSRLWWPWFFRQNTWKFYGQYLERYAVPVLLGYSSDIPKMAEALANAHQDAVISASLDERVETLSGSAVSSGNTLYSEAESMLVRRIEKLILGQTLTSGTDGGSGNRALGEVHNTVREDKVKSDIELVRPTVQRFVNACFRLNGFKGKIPEVVFGDDRQLAAERAKRDAILIEKKIIGGVSEDYIMDNYGFRPGEFTMPEKPTEDNPDEVIEVEKTDGQEEEKEEEGREVKASSGVKFAEKSHPRDLEIEALALWAARRSGSPLEPKDIQAAIEESDSAAELMKKLSELNTRPLFAKHLLDAAEQGLVMGAKDSKKNV